MLTVYKASAGSGKTFRLVAEYLKLCLENETNYRRILAVTFTNKATAEMKQRVAEQLFQIGQNPEKNAYAEILSAETGIQKTELQRRAKETLKNILHDYNRFSISTIDKFTQRVLKAFSREIGAAPNYSLELDNKLLLEETTARLLAGVNENKSLLKWLKKLGEDRIRNNKSFEIKAEIQNLGQEIFKEQFQAFFLGENALFYQRDNLKKYQKKLRGITVSFLSHMKILGQAGLKTIEGSGFSTSDFSFGNSGVAGVFQKINSGDFNFGSRILNGADPEKWVAQKHPQRQVLLGLAESQLCPVLIEIIGFREKNYSEFNTAKKILENFYTLGILNDLLAELDKLRHEKGILPLSDSNLLLKQIIGGSDSPFVYEKTGYTYSHFMLDEFQDTSGLQWENFKPLIANSLAEGKKNLAVGDAKQSIYRWRNSDWKILAQQIEKDFGSGLIQVKYLSQNWRSHPNIIRFNNRVFPILAETISSKLEEETGQPGQGTLIKTIYSDVEQQPGGKGAETEGLAGINFIETDENRNFTEQSLELLLCQVKSLQDAGYSGNDLAILTRKKNEGSAIIRYFLEAAGKPENAGYKLETISNEALLLSSSPSILFVIQLIAHLADPGDKTVRANILNEYKIYIQPALGKNNASSVDWQLGRSFDEEFEAIFRGKIDSVKVKILNAAIDEAIFYLCETFGLFGLDEGLPFIQALIDQASKIKTTAGNGLAAFLDWWETNGKTLSVNVNDDTDAIRLLTIHKAKGLEFKAVLVPFFNWPLGFETSKSPILWCRPEKVPFNALPLVPVKASKDLAESYFRDDYFEELRNSYIDSLNLVYVAFTRAESVLLVNAPLPKNGNTNSVGGALLAALDNLAGDGKIQKISGNGVQTFESGIIPEKSRKTGSAKETIYPEKYTFADFNEKLKLSLNSGDYFSEDGPSNKNLGKLMHELLAEVIVFADFGQASPKALARNKILPGEYKTISEWMNRLSQHPQSREWFSGNCRVFTERPLLSPTKNKRPDRLMISGNKAVIVDYKIEKSSSPNYRKQVAEYAEELKKAGFREVEGYLWFLRENEIEKVCPV